MTRRRWFSRRNVGFAVLVAGGTYVLLLVLSVYGLKAAYASLLAIVVTAIVVVFTVRGVDVEPVPETVHETPWLVPSFPEADDGVETSVARWISRIDFGAEDAVHQMIVDLIDERLHLEHGIDRATAPDAARELVGPQLWEFVTRTRRRRLLPKELSMLLTRMEAL
jgi:hypothetical protein